MPSHIANLADYRKKKSKARVFLALEHLYMEVLTRLEDEQGRINPDEMEEFLVQVLGDHLVGEMECLDMKRLDANYRRFDERLRKCMGTKIRSLQHFEQMR